MINYIKVAETKTGWVTLIVGRQAGNYQQYAKLVLSEGGSIYLDDDIFNPEPGDTLSVMTGETIKANDQFG